MLQIYRSWLGKGYFCYRYIRSRKNDLLREATSFQESVRSSDQHGALLTSMVELQKAQCFYMLAIQIAAIIALSDLKVLHLQSYTHLAHTLKLAYFVAGAGMLPIVFGLFLLHLSGMQSTFIFCLTATTFSLSSVTRFYEIFLTVDPTDIEGPEIPPPSCGGHPGPSTYCSKDEFSVDVFLGWEGKWSSDPLFGYSLFILIILFFDQFIRIRQKSPTGQAVWVNVFGWLSLKMRSRPRLKAFRNLPPTETILKRLRSCVALVFQIVFVWLLLRHFSDLRRLSDELQSEKSDWSVGQIVAILVLLPPIVEYTYLASRMLIFLCVGPLNFRYYKFNLLLAETNLRGDLGGMTAGFQYRLPQLHKVVRQTVKDDYRLPASEESFNI